MPNRSKKDPIEEEKVVLQLYITGMSDNSLRAIQNIKQLCNRFPDNGFQLEIIDIYKDPSLAEKQKIVFSPTLIRQFPLPRKTFIGDLSDTKKLILGLGITFKE